MEPQAPTSHPFFTTFAVGNLIDLWNYIRLQDLTTRLLSPDAMLVSGRLLCSFASSLIIMSGILCLVGPFIQPFMWANNRFLALPNHGLKRPELAAP